MMPMLLPAHQPMLPPIVAPTIAISLFTAGALPHSALWQTASTLYPSGSSTKAP